MPGRARLEAYAVDAARIIRSGKFPLVVALVERDGKSITSMATAIAVEQGRIAAHMVRPMVRRARS